ELLSQEGARRSLEFSPWMFKYCHIDGLAAGALDMRRPVEEQRRKRPQSLKHDENDINLPRDLAGLVTICVQAKINGPSYNLAKPCPGKPIRNQAAPIPWLWVGNCNSGFGCPEYTSRDATAGGTEYD